MLQPTQKKVGPKYILDIEANGLLLDATKIWCVVLKDVASGEILVFDKYFYKLKSLLNQAELIIGHNIINYDLPVLERILGITVPLDKVFDTFVMSRLANYPREPGHSLADFGTILKHPKGDHNDFTQYSEEMLRYCINDVELTYKVFKLVSWELTYFSKLSQDIEQRATYWLTKEQIDGFPIDVPRLLALKDHVETTISTYDKQWSKIFPPKLIVDRVLKYRISKNGEINKRIQKIIDEEITELKGEDLIVYSYQDFNPRSPKQLVERLNEFGWKPTERTKGAIQKLKDINLLTEDELKELNNSGWKVNEVNISTLPDTAPKEAHDLKTYLIYNGRKNKLEEMLPNIGKDNALHSTTFSIGSATHRCAHISPNKANFPAIRSLLGEEFRSCFTVPSSDYTLIGTDAEAIQLRLLAHFMGDLDYIKQVLKEDPHFVHTRRLKLVPQDSIRNKENKEWEAARDKTKTFFYAWTFGAGAPLISSVLKCSIKEAYAFIEAFYEAIPAIRELKDKRIKGEFEKGYHVAIDGRRIPFTSEHKALSVYLQGNEAIIMKRAMDKWNTEATKRKLDYWQVAFVHDEWQTVCRKEHADELIKLQCNSLKETGEEFNLLIPITGTSKIGVNWAETH